MIEQRPCPNCGIPIDCEVTTDRRGEASAQFKAVPHVAPCGLPCADGRDVTISMVMNAQAHTRRCACRTKDEGSREPEPDLVTKTRYSRG